LFVLRHLAACEDCRAFSRECESIEDRLLGEAMREQTVAPPTLHAGIMRAVRTSVPEPVAAASAAPPVWRLATVLGLALVLVYAAFVASPRHGIEESGQDEPAALARMQSDLSSVAIEAPAMVSAPMEREVANLEDDVRRTAEYLLAQLSY
jgi:hypothetical protein